jgi:hypothetical protein
MMPSPYAPPSGKLMLRRAVPTDAPAGVEPPDESVRVLIHEMLEELRALYAFQELSPRVYAPPAPPAPPPTN